MQIHELPTISGSIGSGGYFATDNGSQTTKIDYNALAKAIIEQYNTSTLGGTAQSVKTALDGIKTDLNVVYGANPIKTLAATDDLLTLDVGMYRVANVLPLNAPSTTYKYGYATKQHRGASGYTYYEFVVGNGNGNDFKRYYGWQYSNSATSIDWIEMAPQSAVDELNSKILGYVGKETLSNSTVYSAYGWITGGKKTLFLLIPLNLTNNVSTAAFTSLKVGLRLSTGGYAFGADNTDVTSMITKTVVNKREGVLRVEVASDTDICDTNNICCAGTANFTVTFS